MRFLGVALAATLPAGGAGAAMMENPALFPTWAPPVGTAPPEAATVSDLFLWRRPGTVLDDADALRAPGPAWPDQSARDDALDVDLFGTRPVRPALP
jgi:hypothetical protein